MEWSGEEQQPAGVALQAAARGSERGWPALSPTTGSGRGLSQDGGGGRQGRERGKERVTLGERAALPCPALPCPALD